MYPRFPTRLMVCLLVVRCVPQLAAMEAWRWEWLPNGRKATQQGAFLKVDPLPRSLLGRGRAGPLLALADGGVVVGMAAPTLGDSPSGSLWRFAHGATDSLWTFSGPCAPVPTCLLEAPRGRLWVGTEAGLWVWESDSDRWRGIAGYRACSPVGSTVVSDTPFRLGAITSMASVGDSHLWITTAAGRLVGLSCPESQPPNRWVSRHSLATRAGEPPEMSRAKFVAVDCSPPGTPWAITAEGVLYGLCEEGTWRYAPCAPLPMRPEEAIVAFHVGRNETAWVATREGNAGRVFALARGKWQQEVLTASGPSPGRVTDFAESPSGDLLATMSTGRLLRWRGSRWSAHPANQRLPSIVPYQQAIREATGLSRPGETQALHTPSAGTPLAGDGCHLCFTPNGDLWVAVYQYLFLLHPVEQEEMIP